MVSKKGLVSRRLMVLLLMLLLVLVPACGKQEQSSEPGEGVSNNASQESELLVSAAASLKEALQVIEQDYRQENTGVKVTFNFGSSGTLQRQIEQGAPVDIFISAAQKQMNELEEQGFILSETRQDLLRNEIAVIAAQDNDAVSGLEDLTGDAVSTIAVGIPETVPAGQYTKEALIKLQLWQTLEEKLVMAKDVKQVLTYVETGNADVGFVYLSDAVKSSRIKIIEVLPANLHEPIIYPAAIVRDAPNKEAARAFLAYLNSQQAGEVFAEYGFKLFKGGE